MKASEILAELDRLFGPDYRPSPGGVYPALTALVKERLLVARPDGRAKRYEPTRIGREALQRRRRQLTAIEVRTGVRFGEDGTFATALAQFVERVMRHAGRADPVMVAKVLEAAAQEIDDMEGAGDEER